MGFCRSRIHRTCRNDFDAHVDQRLLEPYLTSLIIRMSLTMITFERFASIWFTCIVFIEIHLKMVRTIVNLMHMYVWACFLDLHNRGILKVRDPPHPKHKEAKEGGVGGAPNPFLDLAPSSLPLSFLCPTEGRAPLSSFEILFAHFLLEGWRHLRFQIQRGEPDYTHLHICTVAEENIGQNIYLLVKNLTS